MTTAGPTPGLSDARRAGISPLALRVRRGGEALVGRRVELDAVRQELAAAGGGYLTALTVEGEPGVGKTRLLLAVAELAADEGLVPLAVTADEEIRGPFLLARGLLTTPAARELAQGTEAEELLATAVDALAGGGDPTLATLAPDQKLLRVLDLAVLAFRALARVRPLALLVDDLQWADEDSVRLIRYLVRTDAALPVLLVLAGRADELTLATEAANLVADMERMGVVRRLKLARFSQVESAELLEHALGGRLDLQTAATMHAQAEGVPFILEELARTYRDAGLVQEIDAAWKLVRNADRLMPSAVRTLIQRRAARVPEETRGTLAEAAILGRSFSLQDLRALKLRVGGDEADCAAEHLAEALAPAVEMGLLVEHPDGSPADYAFTHDQIREFTSASLTPARRRAVHAALVKLLSEGGDPAPESLPLLARHALAAGDVELASRFSVEAARAALEARAPEEVIRLVEQALPVASAARDRVALLTAQDEALEMLRRSADRLEVLAELAALAEALGDEHLELEVLLRRTGALRVSGEEDRAAELAREVQEAAAARGDRQAELAASLELGQALLRSPLGESFSPVASEVDLDGAGAAFARACALAEELGETGALAAATRELGVVDAGRGRALAVERLSRDDLLRSVGRAAEGEDPVEILGADAYELFLAAGERYRRAAELFEQVGDRRGVISSIIALAYAGSGIEIHLFGSARRVEEIRRISQQSHLLAQESERELAELQMLFGVHVFARAKVVPDLALSRGAEAYRQARVLGDRLLEFASAAGVALTHVDLGEVEQAASWVERASAVASAAPTPFRARQLEIVRGTVAAARGDAEGVRGHLSRAAALAREQGRPAALAETLARLALEGARVGAEKGDDELLEVAERAARDVCRTAPSLPGHPPFAAQAEAALAAVALARGREEEAAAAARRARAELAAGRREDLLLDVLLPAGRALHVGGSEDEREAVRTEARTLAAMVAQRILDEDVRVRWFRGPLGRQLSALAGTAMPVAAEPTEAASSASSAGADDALLWLVVEGRANRDIARELGVSEEQVTRRLSELYAALGVSSRAGAALVALGLDGE